MKAILINEALNKVNIRDDANEFLDDLLNKNIIVDGYLDSTGYRALGKTKLIVYVDPNMNNTNFKNLINDNYKETGETSLSSPVYKFKNIYFFYYKSDINEYKFVIRRKKYTSN